jgi:hypothetical protein
VARQREFRRANEPEHDRAARGRGGRVIQYLTRHEGQVGGLVLEVVFGVRAVLRRDAGPVLVGEERGRDHETRLDPRVEERCVGIGSHVVAVGEHDHGEASTTRGGLGSGRFRDAGGTKVRRIADFGDERSGSRQYGRRRRVEIRSAPSRVDERASGNAH